MLVAKAEELKALAQGQLDEWKANRESKKLAAAAEKAEVRAMAAMVIASIRRGSSSGDSRGDHRTDGSRRDSSLRKQDSGFA